MSFLSSITPLRFFTSFVAIGTVLLHMIGDLRHRQYLNYWGIDADMFPKSTDWILINGYYGLFDRFVAIVVAMMGSFYWLVVGVVAFIVIGQASEFLSRLSGSGELPVWLQKQPDWLRRLLRQFLLSTAFVTATPCAIFMLTAFLVVPAVLGETAGVVAAERKQEQFIKGCASSEKPCVELKRNDEIIATGFLLDSSLSHIAILDEQSKKARVIPREKIELVFARSIKSYGASSPVER